MREGSLLDRALKAGACVYERCRLLGKSRSHLRSVLVSEAIAIKRFAESQAHQPHHHRERECADNHGALQGFHASGTTVRFTGNKKRANHQGQVHTSDDSMFDACSLLAAGHDGDGREKSA